MRRLRGESEKERWRMMEASLLHATAVSSRQKAVCIIMGCHLISSEGGSTGGRGRGRARWRALIVRAGARDGRL
ncbi:hypothetical protein PUN28_014441 [Cardiocondyla obscurior]|uniref:Uncharacterized protein n=1 Tax=Cardiocondyla obscurior TaxID=286306 RepID=A0AAW2F4D6_9HYME